MKRLLFATALLAGSACSGSGTPSTPPPVTSDVNTLAKLVLPAGDSHCPTGGISVTVNGGAVEYVCNGAVGPQGPGITQASGSRITVKQAVMVGSDGTRSPATYSYYDNQLATSCTLQTAADGKTRCLPVGVTYGGSYLDSACSVRMMFAQATCPPRYAKSDVILSTGDVCSTGPFSGSRIFSVGQQVFPTPNAGDPACYPLFGVANCTHPGDPCTCVSGGTACVGSSSWYAITELPASTFVEFTSQ